MTEITDEHRREVARRLRDFGESGSPADAIYGGTECYDQMLVRVLRQIVGKGDLFETLADLIDRPTCHNCGGENETNGENYDFACSHCGYCCDISDARFCPRCGAEVAE